FFSIDVAVAKARNASYYADPTQLQAIDQVPGLPKGVAMTARTFRFLAGPRFPVGIDINPPGPFSILNETGVREKGPPQTAASFQTVEGYAAFNPQANFHDPFNIANQNGIVFFPGSAPLYKDISGNGQRVLVGGLGVSGDGVDQDDDVTFQAAVGFEPPSNVPRPGQVLRPKCRAAEPEVHPPAARSSARAALAGGAGPADPAVGQAQDAHRQRHSSAALVPGTGDPGGCTGAHVRKEASL